MRISADTHREHLATGLTGLLADTYALYNSTQVCHWNVEGSDFHALHAMFEGQYRELAEAVDTIAERVRCVGFYAPGSLGQLIKLARVRQPDRLRGSGEMLRHLIESHQQIVHRINELRGEAENALDEATADLLVERLSYHEKTLWMLQSQAGRASAELVEVAEMVRAG